jgi:hypothetical protein
MRRSTADILLCWLTASTVSGIPSTVYALASGGDVLEATRAAGTMLISSDAPTGHLIAAAVLVHGTVSLFWATIVTLVLPRSNVIPYALVAATAIGVFDLKLIGPLFPAIEALSFWPQMADHIMWGLAVGLVLWWRAR